MALNYTCPHLGTQGLTMLENVIDAIKDVLTTNLPAMLRTITTEKGDGVFLADIPAKNIHITEKKRIQNFPSIIIVSDSGTIDYRTSGTKDTTHSFIIACVATDTNEERLTRKLLRYLNAIERVIEGHSKLNDTVIDAMPGGYSQNPMILDKKTLAKDFRIQLTVIDRDTYTHGE